MLSLVIPVKYYHPALAHLISQMDGFVEHVILIGDVADKNLQALAQKYKNIEIIVPPAGGRGAALAKGGAQVKAGWMLFVHADTAFEGEYKKVISDFVNGTKGKAGYFVFKQDAGGWKARGLEALVSLRNALFALPYGDQGLLIHHDLYKTLGGFRADYPLFEDVDLVRKIGRKCLVKLPVAAVTSHDRYKNGYLPRILLNMKCLWLYFIARKHPCDIVDIYLKR